MARAARRDNTASASRGDTGTMGQNGRQGRSRGALFWVVGATLLGTVLITRGTPLFWLGGAFLVSAWAVLRAAFPGQLARLMARLDRPLPLFGQRPPLRAVLLEALYLALITYVATVMMRDIFHGERPVSHDHTVHYYKAWQLHRHFLSEGRLFGWSHRWFAGYPVNYLYPFGTDLWVNLIHSLGFGALSFSRAYGVAFWLFHVLTGVSGYRFGRMLGGPHVGLVTGLLLVTDMAEFRLGGWAYTVDFGVWPQALSLAFGLLALCQLPGLFSTRKLAPIAWFGIWMGIAIVTHPVQLIFLGLLVVVAALATGLARDVKAPVAMLRLLAAIGLSLWVACAWLIPFMSMRGQTNAMGVWWDSTYEMAYGLLNLSSLAGTLGYVLAFGILALVLTLRSERAIVLFSALMALFIPVVCSSTFIDEFRLPALSAAFTKIQYLRMATMVKPFWFALAGYFLVTVIGHFRTRMGERVDVESPVDAESLIDAESPGRSLPSVGARAFVVALLSLPIALPTLAVFWTSHVRKSLRTVDDREYLEDRTRLGRWLEDNLPDDGFYRVGIFMGHNHDLFDLATEFDHPIYKRGFTPCSNFKYKMDTEELAIFDAVNLRYAISKKPLPKEQFEPVAHFGIYNVYRYLRYRAEPFEVLTGSGDVTLRRFEDELIELDVGKGGSGSLRLSVSNFPRWHAYRDGKPVPISETHLSVAPATTGFMTVPLAPGHYRFVFERTLMDRLAVPIGLLGVLFALALWLAERRGFRLTVLALPAGWLDGLSRPSFARGRLVALLSGGGALLLVAVALSEWRPPIELDPSLGAPPIKRVRYDFLESLRDARARINYHEGKRNCVRVGERLICRDRDGHLDGQNYVGSFPTTIEEYRMVRCIRARPEQGGPLSIYYPSVPRGDALVGYYGNDFEGRLLKLFRPVDLQIDVDGKRVYGDRTESDDRMHWFNVPIKSHKSHVGVAFHISARNAHKRWFCFYAQMVDF